MCGIAGVVGTFDDVSVHRLRAQSSIMACRGPDAEGFWRDESAALCHRRLAIIGLSPRANQPIESPSGRYVLTFNGEIYNFRALPHASTFSDTQALVGDTVWALAPEQLRGMFAYGLWDREDHRLFLARDRFGIKPLYYSDTGNALIFASTARAVAAIRGHATLDREAIASYLRRGSVQGPRTMFEGIHELEPGCTLTWSTGTGSRRQRYWWFDHPEGGRAPPVASDDLPGVLSDSVAAHAISDVPPIALFLSGGLDSAVLGYFAREAGLDFTAYTIALPGSLHDETLEARETARVFGLRHHVIDASDSPDFDAFFAAADQPSIDGLNTYIVAGVAARAGFRVALSGIGADELFAGYSTFRRIPMLSAFNSVVPEQLGRRVLNRVGGNQSRAPGLVAAGRSFALLHEELRSVFVAAQVESLTGVTATPHLIENSWRHPMDRVSRMESETYLACTLLRDADVFAMAHSLELRTPFVDHWVLAAARSIPDIRRFATGKKAIARALGHPRLAALARAPKQGFALPFREWLAGALQPRVEALCNGPLVDVLAPGSLDGAVSVARSPGASPVQLWSLVVLDAWMRRNTTG